MPARKTPDKEEGVEEFLKSLQKVSFLFSHFKTKKLNIMSKLHLRLISDKSVKIFSEENK